MSIETALWLRQKRQGFSKPFDGGQYDELFRGLSPVMCEYWSRPGDPPRLFQRATEDDFTYNDSRRPGREILKGRFQGGGIAYVARADMELFACLYKKQTALNKEALEILAILENEGPLSSKQIRDITGYGKLVPAALQKLQEAFLVFEDQTDCEWDRGFYAFSQEFPDINFERYTRHEALLEVLPRFWRYMVLANGENAKSYYKLAAKEINAAVEELLRRGVLSAVGENMALTEDLLLLSERHAPEKGIFALHRNDFLVKAHEHELKDAYPHEKHKVIYYLLIDGKISGAILGRFSNIINELEELVFDNPADAGRVDEVHMALAAVTEAKLVVKPT